MVHLRRTPIIPRTAAQKERLEKLRIKLALYRWDADDDMMTHIIKVNQMIQDIIWNGFVMPGYMMVEALKCTIPDELGRLIDRVWDTLEGSSYKMIVEQFMIEYIRLGARRTSTLALNWSRRNTMPESRGFPAASIWMPKQIEFPEDFHESFPVYRKRITT